MRLPGYVLLALLSFFGWASSASAGPDPTLSSSYYSHINAPCAGGDCSALRKQLDQLQSGECERIEKSCEPATEILKMLFGDGHRPNLPDFVVYFKQDGTGKFEGKPRGVLMFKGLNTPHLFGARDVYALVFSETRVCMDAFVTVDFKSEPNPFTGIFAAIGGKADDAKTTPSTHTLANFTWYPLSGDSDPKKAGLWMGLARVSIDVNSVDRLNIQYKQPNQTAGKDVPEECTQGADRPKAFTGSFASANAFFSNSPDSHIGVSIALGMTRNPKDTSVSTGDGSKEYFNGYAFAKYYVRRPRLRAGPEADSDPRDLSFALVLGTNVTKSTFSEIVYGVSLGHIVGNMGVVAGVNSMQGAKDSNTGRKSKPFVGLEYSF